eukprot:15419514-Heterocapsa_arctica.AAC.1
MAPSLPRPLPRSLPLPLPLTSRRSPTPPFWSLSKAAAFLAPLLSLGFLSTWSPTSAMPRLPPPPAR